MKNSDLETADEDIQLKDVVCFLRFHWKLIVIFGMVGLFFSVVYVTVTRAPEKFEAMGQMQVAKIGNNSNAEEPDLLIQRLRFPAVYSIKVRQLCGMPEDGEFGDYLDGKLEIKLVKNARSTIELKVSAGSAEQARQCVEAVVTMLFEQQRDLIEERLSGQKKLMAEYQRSWAEKQRQSEKIKMLNLGALEAISMYVTLNWLHARINTLQEEITLSRSWPAKLTVPVYALNQPVVMPSRIGLVLSGMLCGLMVGVLLALGLESRRKAA